MGIGGNGTSSREILDAVLANDVTTTDELMRLIRAQRGPKPETAYISGAAQNRSPITGEPGDRGIFSTALGRSAAANGAVGPFAAVAAGLANEATAEPDFGVGSLVGPKPLDEKDASGLLELLNVQDQSSLGTLSAAALAVALGVMAWRSRGQLGKILSKVPGGAKLGAKLGKAAEAGKPTLAVAREALSDPKALEAARAALETKSGSGLFKKVLGGLSAVAMPLWAANEAAGLYGRVRGSSGDSSTAPPPSESAEALGEAVPGRTAVQQAISEITTHDPMKLKSSEEWWKSMAQMFRSPDDALVGDLSRELLSAMVTEATTANQLESQARAQNRWGGAVKQYFGSIAADPAHELPVIPGSSVPTDDMVRAANAVRHGIDWVPPRMRVGGM